VLPVSAILCNPIFGAVAIARSTFAEFPLVEMPMATSPEAHSIEVKRTDGSFTRLRVFKRLRPRRGGQDRPFPKINQMCFFHAVQQGTAARDIAYGDAQRDMLAWPADRMVFKVQ
jgi:hypothetical protein